MKLSCFKGFCCCSFSFSPTPLKQVGSLLLLGSWYHRCLHHHVSSFHNSLPRQQDAAYPCCFHTSRFCCHNNTIILAFYKNSNFKSHILKASGFIIHVSSRQRRFVQAICKLSYFFWRGIFHSQKWKADSNCWRQTAETSKAWPLIIARVI